jgi:hypothetical protein
MKWLNLNLELLRDDRFIEAEPQDQATWLKLLAYCCTMENGGFIRDAHKWNDRRWLMSAAITKADYDRQSELWKNEVGHVVVWGYPSTQEKEVKRMRGQSKKAAEKRWYPKREMPDGNA